MTLDQRARDAATTMREKLDAIAIPEPAAVVRRARRRRLGGGVLAIVAVASAVAIIAGVAGTGSTKRIEVSGQKEQPSPTPTTIAKVPSRPSIPEAALRQLQAALDAWSTFPVDASPRPLILTSDPVSAPASGFRTGDDKEAFLSGAFAAPATLPSGPQNAAGYPVIGAAQALAAMRAEGSSAIGAIRPPSPLVITAVNLATSSFETDRGTRLLPAWMFSFQGVEHSAAVLAVAPSSRYSPPSGSNPASAGARLGTNGRTVTITFVGAAPGRGPCTADYTVDQLASETAVAIRVRETNNRRGTCRLVGYARHVAIVLASPLGGRVLVDATTKAPVAIAL
jgi:hypothetical protein